MISSRMILEPDMLEDVIMPGWFQDVPEQEPTPEERRAAYSAALKSVPEDYLVRRTGKWLIVNVYGGEQTEAEARNDPRYVGSGGSRSDKPKSHLHDRRIRWDDIVLGLQKELGCESVRALARVLDIDRERLRGYLLGQIPTIENGEELLTLAREYGLIKEAA